MFILGVRSLALPRTSLLSLHGPGVSVLSGPLGPNFRVHSCAIRKMGRARNFAGQSFLFYFVNLDSKSLNRQNKRKNID
jgi:hypothetical protein